jgi:hypothetical protein
MIKNLQKEGNAVELCVNYLFEACGSHEKAAEYVGYSIRQYRDIRRKIETGYILPPRIENLIRAKVLELQRTGA